MSYSTTQIAKDNAEALLEDQVVKEIFKDVERESKALSLFRKLPNMSSDKTKLRVSDALPLVYFVDEGTNNGRKQLTTSAWKNVFITAEELACIVPIKENLLNDADVDLWAEIRPQLTNAIAKAVDDAIFNGTGAPQSWGGGIIPAILSKSTGIETTGHLYSDINDTMTAVEKSGYNVNALLGGVGLKGKFRMMTDTTGQPLNTTEIGSIRREFMDNGVWNKNTSTLVVGDFSQAVYSIRQDVTYKVLTEAVIQDPSDGSIIYNLAQDDMVALRVVMRLGWEIPNPVNAENETSARFPFASIKPEGSVSL